jgi:hypothetical protein
MTRIRLIVGLITHILMYLTVTKPVREAKARIWAVAQLMMMMIEPGGSLSCLQEPATLFILTDRPFVEISTSYPFLCILDTHCLCLFI